MNATKVHGIVAAAVAAAASALAFDWLDVRWIGPSGWTLRAALWLLGAGAGAAVVGLLVRRVARDDAASARCLDALRRIASGEGDGEDLPRLPAGHRLGNVAGRLAEAVQAERRRIEELEHARAALEVRSRRTASETEQVRAILAQLAEPIVAVDQYGEMVLANRSAKELLGFDDAKTETRALDRLVRCEKLVELLLGTARRKTSGSRTDEVEIADEQGRSHWYRATACKLPATGPSVSDEPVAEGAVVVLRDIGEQKAVQKRHAEFVSAVSHEMKTPLAGIKAYVELLADGEAEDEETREEFLGVIAGQADRLQRLVENMLNLARIEAGVVHVSKRSQSLNELLEEALRVVQPAAEAKRIELVSDLSPMYLGVLADRDMLLQAAINLLSNAIKYTPEEGRVTLRSRLAGNEVRFDVEDTGVGLSEEDCQRVFEKFYRVGKDKNMASGTGLGLPLARHIVEDVHGGKLNVQSEVGRGSTFSVTLPTAGQMS